MSKKKKEIEKKTCKVCKRNLASSGNFYRTNSKLYPDKRIDICRKCLLDIIDENDIDSLKNVLRQIDKPFVSLIWERSKESGGNVIGKYFRQINSMHQYKDLTWGHGEKDTIIDDSKHGITNEEMEEFDIHDLKEKYGYGYPDNEYYLFEKKYIQLKPSFNLMTTMHEEYFKEYCINKVKETLAKARGDLKEAKDWANMVKDVADAGKLKPSQMSKADLSDGLDGFGQLARAVEEKYELMEVLPKFIEKPKDKVDVVLWLFINYIRDLKGMSEVKYEEIWKFYEERREDYEKNQLDNDPSLRNDEGDLFE